MTNKKTDKSISSPASDERSELTPMPTSQNGTQKTKKSPKTKELTPITISATPTSLKNTPNLHETPQYKVYLHWKAQPPSERKFGRLEDFMAAYSMSKEDILAIKTHPNFEDDLMNATILWAKNKTPQLFHLMYGKIKDKKKSQDLKLWLEMLEGPKSKTNNQQINVFNFSDNLGDKQRQQILERLQRKTDE